MLPGARSRVAVDQDAPLQADQHQRGEHERDGSCDAEGGDYDDHGDHDGEYVGEGRSTSTR